MNPELRIHDGSWFGGWSHSGCSDEMINGVSVLAGKIQKLIIGDSGDMPMLIIRLVMACDDEVIPLQSRIEMVSDISDLEEVYNTERHLLYVACTRARDHLLISGVDPASEFLDDMVR